MKSFSPKYPAANPPATNRQILIFDGTRFLVGRYDADAFFQSSPGYCYEDAYYRIYHPWQCVWWTDLPAGDDPN
jgi:hypothetical protein